MASQTKVEPEAIGTAGAVPPAGGAPTADAAEGGAYTMDGDEAPDAAVAADADSMPAPAGDDEDVALEELMVSDLGDLDDEDDEPEEATEVHPGFGRLRDEVYASDELLTPPPQTVDAEVSLELSEVEDDEAAALAAASAAQEAVARAAEEAREKETAAPAEADGHVEAAQEPAADGAEDRVAADAVAGTDDAAPDTLEAVVSPDSEAELPSTPVNLEPLEQDTAPASLEVKRPDAPLPSFEIPEGEATEGEDRAASAAHPTADSSVESRGGGRSGARPMEPLEPLSEVADDDDDVITHIGLPVPETASDYSEFGQGGFQVADTGMAALQGYENLNLLDTRRATTRLVPRINPSQLELGTPPPPSTDYVSRLLGGLSAAVGAGLSRLRGGSTGELEPQLGIGEPPPQRMLGWLRDKVLPPLSLVLAGSGIGAGILLLQIDRDADPSAEQAQAVQALKEASSTRATTLIERAEAGESDALFKIANMADAERSSALTLAGEAGHQARKLNEFNEFARSFKQPAAGAAPNSVSRLIGYATSPETMLPAFRYLSQWPGSRGPDVLYAVWEKAPGGSRAASLAQQLLNSADQRSKTTPALTTALDLRAATACEDYLRLLPKVLSDGDQRCSATLRSLKHTDGCGDDGQSDCYACLREGPLLDQALAAVEKRPAPQL